MSFPTPVLGFTVRNLATSITDEVVDRFVALVAEHQDALTSNIDQIDPAGITDYSTGTALSDELLSGYVNLIHYHADGGWDIPNTDGHQFHTITLNDGVDSADEFDRLSLLINACTAVPAFGQAVGIIGEGIQVS